MPRPSSRHIIPVLAALAALPATAAAQSWMDTIRTPSGPCAVGAPPPGGSNPEDASWTRCAVDRQPALLPGWTPPPLPRFASRVYASYFIAVSPEGTVDSALTRMWSYGGDREFAERALRTVWRWRFAPGMRRGEAVRTGWNLEVVSDVRPSDTLPARMEWRYAVGPDRDTLHGTWVAEPPLPPFDAQVVDSVHVAMLRRLAAMRVLVPAPTRQYCLAAADSGAAAARLVRIARRVRRDLPGLTIGECADAGDRVRVLLPTVHRTEGGRAVLHVAGARLPRWPSDFEARAWARWRGRCIADVRDVAAPDVACHVGPDTDMRERGAWYRTRMDSLPSARAARAGEPVRITLLATLSGAVGIDTMRTTLRAIPSLAERALRDSAAACNGWLVHATRDSTTYVLHGDPAERSFHVTRATWRRPPKPAPTADCGERTSRPDRLVVFLLGGIGDPPRDTVTLCFADCARRYSLDRGRHTVAPRPHFVVRLAALSEGARQVDGERQLRLRLYVDPVPGGLVPLVIIRPMHRVLQTAWVPRQLRDGAWEYNVTYTAGLGLDAEAYVYLMRR